MKIQTLPFPKTPEEAVAVMSAVKLLLAKYYAETGDSGREQDLPPEAMAVFWHSYSIDFVELLNDENQRVGIVMLSIATSEAKQDRYGQIAVAYIEPEYRSQGWFKKMIAYIKTVSQARQFSKIEITVPSGSTFTLGEPVGTVYRMEL